MYVNLREQVYIGICSFNVSLQFRLSSL